MLVTLPACLPRTRLARSDALLSLLAAQGAPRPSARVVSVSLRCVSQGQGCHTRTAARLHMARCRPLSRPAARRPWRAPTAHTASRPRAVAARLRIVGRAAGSLLAHLSATDLPPVCAGRAVARAAQVVCSEKTCERVGKLKATGWGGVDNPIISHGYGAGLLALASPAPHSLHACLIDPARRVLCLTRWGPGCCCLQTSNRCPNWPRTGFLSQFVWDGARDYSAFLAIEQCLGFWRRHPAALDYARALALWASSFLCARWSSATGRRLVCAVHLCRLRNSLSLQSPCRFSRRLCCSASSLLSLRLV